jgi:Icc-related predicted phosphoesterase
MTIFHFSDTHGLHREIEIPPCDMVVFSGDECSSKDSTGYTDSMDFIDWFSRLDTPVKIMIAGNYSFNIEHGIISKEYIESKGIVYLENSVVEIRGLSIWGSPYTPAFSDGSFLLERGSLGKVYEEIPEGVDIIIQHGPPYSILDLTRHESGELEFCGCKQLLERIQQLKKLKAVLFGHIHDTRDVVNHGIRHVDGIIYSNGTVTTNKRTGIITKGNLVEL